MSDDAKKNAEEINKLLESPTNRGAFATLGSTQASTGMLNLAAAMAVKTGAIAANATLASVSFISDQIIKRLPENTQPELTAAQQAVITSAVVGVNSKLARPADAMAQAAACQIVSGAALTGAAKTGEMAPETLDAVREVCQPEGPAAVPNNKPPSKGRETP